MNSKKKNESQNQDIEKIKEIPKWTRRYAQNRTLTIPVLMVMGMLLIMFIAVVVVFPLHLAVAGFRRGNAVLGWIGISCFIAAIAAVLMFLIIFISQFCVKRSGLIEQMVEQWIYGKEGTVSTPLPKMMKKDTWLEVVFSIVFFICFFGSWYLAMKGYIASKYLQPISVLYWVPFSVYEYFQLWPRVGPLILLFQILYTIHAILILAGVPIFFTGDMGIWNLFIPIIGYSIVTYVICHVYSRYALKKLKGITHIEGDGSDGD